LFIDPKILEPYVPIPGRVPRKVAIDRKKKEYASFRIEDLLVHEVKKEFYFAQIDKHISNITFFEYYFP
jgi:hypothetical protein